MQTKDMIQYIPSKQLLVSMGTILAIVGIYIYIETHKENQEVSTLSVISVSDMANKDSDYDGVPDWEEDLWGTDAEKPSTFEGTLDSIYIQNKKAKRAIDLGIDLSVATSTKTELFARDLLATVSALGANESIDATKLGNSIASSTLSQIEKDTAITPYREQDIKIRPLASESLYKKNVFRAFATKGNKKPIEEYSLIYNAMVVSPNIQTLEEASSYAAVYGTILKTLLATEVPPAHKDEHLVLVNSVLTIQTALLSITQMQTDTLPGAGIFALYDEGVTGVFTMLDSIEKIQ